MVGEKPSLTQHRQCLNMKELSGALWRASLPAAQLPLHAGLNVDLLLSGEPGPWLGNALGTTGNTARSTKLIVGTIA